MDIEHTDFLQSDGDSYVEYKMYGFNVFTFIGDNVEDSFGITENKPYVYENHSYLHSFFINDDFSKIIFWMKAGFDADDYLEEIGLELERICFNLIIYKNLHTSQPVCKLMKIKTCRRNSHFEDRIRIKEELKCKTMVQSNSFYADIVAGENAMLDKNKYFVYKQIFDILRCQNLVIQYMSLYDLLKECVCQGKCKSQKGVVQFFKNNQELYPEVKFSQSRGKNGNDEDSYTFLRNKIGHPWGLPVDEIKKLGINANIIQSLLAVINDVLCEKCVIQGIVCNQSENTNKGN